jgi:hypothetical protein
MRTIKLLALGGMLLGSTAFAGQDHDDCSVRALAGKWMFATDVGKQTFFTAGGDITAIGTFRVDRAGNVRGSFDATVANLAFLPKVAFDGKLTVEPDCTGTLTFTTSAGTTRTDSIVVLNGGWVRGMSQDVQFLWTYDMRRL